MFGAIAGEVGRARIVAQGDEAVEGLIGGAIVAEVWWRNVGEITELEFAVEPDEAVGVGEREWAKDDGVDDAEDGGVCADAERESEDGDEGEAGIFAERAKGVAEILGEVVEYRGDTALVARGLLDQGDVAEFAVSAFGGLLRRGAAVLEIGGGHLEMGLEFGVEVGAIVRLIVAAIFEEVHGMNSSSVMAQSADRIDVHCAARRCGGRGHGDSDKSDGDCGEGEWVGGTGVVEQ